MARAKIGQSDAANLRKVLITLLQEQPAAQLPSLAEKDWDEIDRLAGLHRVQPLLHHRHHENLAVPQEIRNRWNEAHRLSSFTALQHAGELATTTTLLQAAGHSPIALKGAWLAWHAYPHPALRPMRDIDLWLTPESVIAAYELLLAHGYRRAGEQQLTLAQSLALDKHLPPLCSPRGVFIELHHRLWEIGGRMDHAAPISDQARLRERAIEIDGLDYLHPQDTLAHLIIHAVYDHRLDCGPLLLSDVTYLLRRAEVDWDSFWAEARDGGWERGAALVLAMVRDHAPDLALPALPAGVVPPDRMGAELMLQELDTRQSAGVWATLRAGGFRPFILRVLARRGRSDAAPVARDLSGQGGFAAWARSRLVRTARELARSDVRQQSRQLASLSRWLDE